MKCYFYVFLFILFATNGTAQYKKRDYSLWFDKPAKHWLEALPLGNGRIGAMVFSDPFQERIQFNESSLITGDDKTVGFYQPFGNVFLSSQQMPVTAYKRELDLGKGLHTLEFISGNTVFKRESFCSYPDGVFVMMLTSDKPKGINTTVQLKDERGNKSMVGNGNIKFSGQLDNKLKYAATLHLKSSSGKLIMTDTSIEVNEADTLLLMLSAATNMRLSPSSDFLGPDPQHKLDSIWKDICNLSYAALKSRHINDFSNLYGRVNLDLGDIPKMPSDQRLERYAKGGKDPALEALLFQYGRYLLISSSRKGGFPANLQGIWNNDFKPAWYSQYTTNINVEMNYWPAEQTNLSECHFPFFDWVENLAKKNRNSKDSMLKVEKGWVAYSTNNLIGGPSKWRLHRPGSAWMSRHFWDHYAFTGDKGFLEARAYPLLKELAQYWESHLVVGPNGKMITPDGWSPEHGPGKNEQDKSPYPGASYDQQIVYDLLTNYISAERMLKKDKVYLESMTRLRKNMLGPQIGRWGQLQEWMEDVDDSTDRHRHNSHLFAVHPGTQISPMTDKRFAAAASLALDARGNNSTGWSAAWRMNIRARLQEPEKAYDLIRTMLRPVGPGYKSNGGSGLCPNFFDAYPPFQMDGNFGYTSGITEMLLQSHLNEVHLLPALPNAWTTGSVSGLKARGNIEVGITWKNGIMESCLVKPAFTGDYTIRYKGKTVKLHLIAKQLYRLNGQLQKK